MTILANAVSSIRLGVEDYQLAEHDEARALSAIRNLTSGLLLLFKVKLQELSPVGSDEVLLKAKVVPAIDATTGAAVWVGKGNKTVDVEDVIERLKGLGVTDVEWKLLLELRTIRNAIEHYYSTKPVAAVLEAIAASFNLIHQFVPKHLDKNPADLLGEECWQFLVDQEDFYKKELEQCRNEMNKLKWPLGAHREAVDYMRCPECQSELIRPYDANEKPPTTEFTCTKCGVTSPFEKVVIPALQQSFAGQLYEAASQGGEPGLDRCYDCGRHTFAVAEGRCAICLVEGETSDCSMCETPMTREEIYYNEKFCGYCNHMYEKTMRE